ncbi:MAG: hypothetical protein DLM55_09215 [Acidimicrobiales bacterium]|nr:MAG: hypothetical protein DLM55_09215 [Acidimicrobiales bacterium]
MASGFLGHVRPGSRPVRAGGVPSPGQYVEIQHPANILTRYRHMLRAPGVTIGQTVQGGQPLGVIGSSNFSGPTSTSKSTKPHPVNPRPTTTPQTQSQSYEA